MAAESPLTHLSWLPAHPHWHAELDALRVDPAAHFDDFVRLAHARLDALQTLQLDRALQRHLSTCGAPVGVPSVRVALLASSTVRHLISSVRLAALRRGLRFDLYEGAYGQSVQELLDPASALTASRPEVIVFAFDAHHLASLAAESVDAALAHLQQCWRQARERFGATVIQQTALPIFPSLLGSNEHRLGTGSASRIAALNAALRPAADQAGVHLLSIDNAAYWDGIDAWYSPALWNYAKQEVHPAAAPLWGDLLARVIAAERGRSAKCLVLDLDNTLWGGVVGDDGPAGLVIGEGSAAGEAHLGLQQLCVDLRRRGILLAVCSKNDDTIARAAFAQRPEMPLAVDDFASFRANWDDKAANLRAIARELRLGLDSLVFLDDNPAERALIRRELPAVHVPELPEDPALFAQMLLRAGYFESIALTGADLARAEQYAANSARHALESASTDMAGYLASLRMTVRVCAFDEANLPRIVQLANKTNQFNLTTERLSDEKVRRWIADPARRTWQIELSDRFGDHGTVALLAGFRSGPVEFTLDLWLMSCRVLGRAVEDACLNYITQALRELGVKRLVGLYRPSGRNGLVGSLYGRLGFDHCQAAGDPGSHLGESQRWVLDVARYEAHATAIAIETGTRASTSTTSVIL